MGRTDIAFVDVREPEEYAGGHVDGATNLPLSKLLNNPSLNLPKSGKIVLYCNSGNRSGLARNIFYAQGYKDVENGINQKEIEKHYKV